MQNLDARNVDLEPLMSNRVLKILKSECAEDVVTRRNFKFKKMETENQKPVEEQPVEKAENETGELEKIKQITMPKEQAKEEWKKYLKLLEERKEKFLKVMKDSMFHIKEGRNLIDVYVAMANAGLNEKSEPKLAIARADLREVAFEKRDTGTGNFGQVGRYGGIEFNKDRVELPQNTFKNHWARQVDERTGEPSNWSIDKKLLKTKVPIIPVELVPEGKLENYYILWEVSTWEELPEANKDPFLLKRISENLFVILGAWEVTELEQAVLRGLKE